MEHFILENLIAFMLVVEDKIAMASLGFLFISILFCESNNPMKRWRIV